MIPHNKFGQEKRKRDHSHATPDTAIYREIPAANGVPLRCQYCSGQTFRRSTLRPTDFTQILLMRYPVRCLRCSQRQMVSFTVAGISLSSSVKPIRPVTRLKHWTDLPKPSGTHQTPRSPSDPE
jgi:hypothetical protein